MKRIDKNNYYRKKTTEVFKLETWLYLILN